jgi:hypothetical protein
MVGHAVGGRGYVTCRTGPGWRWAPLRHWTRVVVVGSFPARSSRSGGGGMCMMAGQRHGRVVAPPPSGGHESPPPPSGRCQWWDVWR